MELTIGQYHPPDWRGDLTIRLIAYVMSRGAPVEPDTAGGLGGVARDVLDHRCLLTVGEGAVLQDVSWEPVPGLTETVLVLTQVGCACGRYSGLRYAAPGSLGEVLEYLMADDNQPRTPGG